MAIRRVLVVLDRHSYICQYYISVCPSLAFGLLARLSVTVSVSITLLEPFIDCNFSHDKTKEKVARE